VGKFVTDNHLLQRPITRTKTEQERKVHAFGEKTFEYGEQQNGNFGLFVGGGLYVISQGGKKGMYRLGHDCTLKRSLDYPQKKRNDKKKSSEEGSGTKESSKEE